MRILLLILWVLTATIGYSQELLISNYPLVEKGEPQPGKKIRQTLPLYYGTDVHHMLYLPINYNEKRLLPVIVELTGNKWKYGNGTVEDAHMGYSISLGRDFIWVVPPYVNKEGTANETLWWGSIDRTVEYIQNLVSFLIRHYKADPRRIFLCGFSRGAIGCSLIGLNNPDIASLWCGFISHDHFDGQQSWYGTDWGYPLVKYRQSAKSRLKRVNGRDWYLSFNSRADLHYRKLLSKDLQVEHFGNYFYASVDIRSRISPLPNSLILNEHNDCWPAYNLPESIRLRYWLNKMNNKILGKEIWHRDYVEIDKLHAFGLIYNFDEDEQYAYIFVDNHSGAKKVMLEYKINDGNVYVVRDKRYPFEFKIPLGKNCTQFIFRLSDGQVVSDRQLLIK